MATTRYHACKALPCQQPFTNTRHSRLLSTVTPRPVASLMANNSRNVTAAFPHEETNPHYTTRQKPPTTRPAPMPDEKTWRLFVGGATFLVARFGGQSVWVGDYVTRLRSARQALMDA